ncbi:MAG: 3' terminal RNA ribose 2'-O-methyltransferase Hen1 [Alphaproteobacteria bacterium]|nr:3' terminal RNA ribose 2'-O-methyltransferase Hen1 [Alphaproteobacteria bacterium]
MLLTITTTHKPATDMGYLLHKSPDRLHSKELPFGMAHVFYPEASEKKCTAALLLDIDPVGLVRNEKGASFSLEQYVNDRPYVASSFMSVAINRVFGTLLSGKSKHRQELVEAAIPLEAVIYSLPCRAQKNFLRELFEPLDYAIEIENTPLDPKFPKWGGSPYYTVRLRKTCPLRELLTHLYVLIPVLDNKKHYFIGDAEVEKLLQYGEGWLKDHPQKDLIARRYFRNLRSFSRMALEQLKEDAPEDEEDEEVSSQTQKANAKEEALEESLSENQPEEKKISLHRLRHETVITALKEQNVRSVLDVGCGEGKLLRILKKERGFSKIAGCDVSTLSLEIANERLQSRFPKHGEPEIELFQSALTYRDKRFKNFDALVLVEVIEHVDETRLPALERAVFSAGTGVVLVTTPNGEYNVLFETLPAGQFRHADHRFEWTRKEFEDWGSRVAGAYGYDVTFSPIGEVYKKLGGPSQMAVFVKPEPEDEKKEQVKK